MKHLREKFLGFSVVSNRVTREGCQNFREDRRRRDCQGRIRLALTELIARKTNLPSWLKATSRGCGMYVAGNHERKVCIYKKLVYQKRSSPVHKRLIAILPEHMHYPSSLPLITHYSYFHLSHQTHNVTFVSGSSALLYRLPLYVPG